MSVKELEAFAQMGGLTWDARRKAAYGRIQGYEAVLAAENGGKEYRISVGMDSAQPEALENLRRYLDTFPQGRPDVIAASIANRTMTLGIRSGSGQDTERISRPLREILSFCQTNGVAPCCRYCGAHIPVHAYGVDGQVDYLCDSCYSYLEQHAQDDHKKRFGNRATGMIGAVIGSLLGVVLWVVLYEMNFIAGIAGLAMLLFALKGYQLLGGTVDTAGVVICVIISVLMLLVAENVTLIVEVFKLYRESYSFVSTSDLDIFSIVRVGWASPEIRGGMLADLAMGYFLYFISGISYVYQLFQSAKNRKELVRLC